MFNVLTRAGAEVSDALFVTPTLIRQVRLPDAARCRRTRSDSSIGCRTRWCGVSGDAEAVAEPT